MCSYSEKVFRDCLHVATRVPISSSFMRICVLCQPDSAELVPSDDNILMKKEWQSRGALNETDKTVPLSGLFLAQPIGAAQRAEAIQLTGEGSVPMILPGQMNVFPPQRG